MSETRAEHIGEWQVPTTSTAFRDGEWIEVTGEGLEEGEAYHYEGPLMVLPSGKVYRWVEEAGERAANDKAHLATLASLEKRNQT